jgi:Holliday junction resolvase-like predicted endonuclease
MKTEKDCLTLSTRHQKIAGEYGEYLVLFKLSKRGWECVRIDHTGIDLIAYHKGTERRIGIRVMTRTRTNSSKNGAIDFSVEDLKKIERAGVFFAAVPYMGIALDRNGEMECHLFSLEAAKAVNGLKVGALRLRTRPQDVARCRESIGTVAL